MAELPSPDDDHRPPPDEPGTVVSLIRYAIEENKRTNNLIRLVLAIAVPALAALAVVAFALVVMVKGVHVIENRGAWAAGGVVGGPTLVSTVIWARRRIKRRALSDGATRD